jgi:hypothetical protein
VKHSSLLLYLLFFCAIHKPATAQNTQVNLLPDFNKISLQDLDKITEGGEIGTEFNAAVGYDISRQFNAGDNVEDVLQIGDLEASLAPQLFSLKDINNRLPVARDLSTIRLSEFALLENQTLENLVDAIPELGKEQAANIDPIKDLLEQEGFSSLENLEALITTNQTVANLKLGLINLENYSLDSIPNLTDTELDNFEKYQESIISEIPGLSEVPLGNFENGIPLSGSFIARIDFVWGGAESDRQRTISGSYVDGFAVPCDRNCEYLELDDFENLGSSIQSSFEGKQWIAGREHYVGGGTGCFAGGREATGIHPFGNTFKVVLWRTDETTDSAEVVMFFNIKTKCGETPYFIGPIPFPLGFVKVNDYVFIGVGS